MQKYIITQTGISLFVYIGYILVGYGMNWSAPVVPKLQDIEQTPLDDVITDAQASWVGSLFFVGAIIGPYAAGYIANRFGRKFGLMMGGAFLVLANIILATAVDLAMIYAGRIIIGLGNGILSVISLMYLGEIASPDIRGAILSGGILATTIGTVVVYSIAPYVDYAVVFYIALGLSVVFVVGMFFAPETPVFYVINGREEEARKAMIALGITEEDEISKVITSVKSAKEEATKSQSAWRELFYIRSNRKALYILVGLGVIQQLTGSSVVMMFSTTIFDMAGSTIDPDIATIIIGVVQLISVIMATSLIEKSGRKILLMGSSVVCSIALAVFGVYFFLDDQGNDMEVVGWLPLVTLMVFFISFNMGMGIIPLTMIGEVFGGSARSAGSSLTLTFIWLISFGTTTAFGYLVPVVGIHYLFWFFSVACIGTLVYTIFFVPETKGKSLNEIQALLSK